MWFHPVGVTGCNMQLGEVPWIRDAPRVFLWLEPREKLSRVASKVGSDTGAPLVGLYLYYRSIILWTLVN